MPRAGPLRYWSLTLIGGVLVLGSVAAVVWGTYELIGTESCGTRTTSACDSETALHILAVTVAPFVGGLGALMLAFRGGGTLRRWGPRKRRLADQIARGEAQTPTVARPGPMPAPIAPLIPVPEPAPPAAEKTPIERLQELDRLKSKDLISVGEYEAQKKRILGGT